MAPYSPGTGRAGLGCTPILLSGCLPGAPSVLENCCWSFQGRRWGFEVQQECGYLDKPFLSRLLTPRSVVSGVASLVEDSLRRP